MRHCDITFFTFCFCCFLFSLVGSILLGFISPVALWIFQKRLILPEAICFKLGDLDGFGQFILERLQMFATCMCLACAESVSTNEDEHPQDKD